MDPEIEAMGQIAGALARLEPDATRRVLRWAVERFSPRDGSTTSPSEVQNVGGATPASSGSDTQRTFASFSDLFDAANPQMGLEKILVAAYWFQVHEGNEDWDSQRVNTELKHLGHPSSNITRDLAALINRTPRFVLQVRKDGSHQQARKRYKLTREGIRAVEQMIRATDPLNQV